MKLHADRKWKIRYSFKLGLLTAAALLITVVLFAGACGAGGKGDTGLASDISAADASEEVEEIGVGHDHDASAVDDHVANDRVAGHERDEGLDEDHGAVIDGAPEVFVAGAEFAFNPEALVLKVGEPVTIVFTNNGLLEHDMIIDAFDFQSHVHNPGESYRITLTPDRAGTFIYYCSIPGHKEAGMEGTLMVS